MSENQSSWIFILRDVQPIIQNIILSIHKLFFLLCLPVWCDPLNRKKAG